VILAFASISFSRHLDDLVITPLQFMHDMIVQVSSNPMGEPELEERMMDETHFVATALLKFVKLLQVSFGMAGKHIIAENLSQNEGEINPMIKGRKKRCIFGFCDIHQFNDVTEHMTSAIFPYVNSISSYVHNACHDNLGQANKNIGDVFLLTWRLADPPDGTSFDKLGKMYSDESIVADAALRSFVRSQLQVAPSAELKKFTNDETLQACLPNFTTKMGFGLHIGWAIEGSIGSPLKVDASYLSPNVNMASRLMAATKQYGVTILVSEHFFSMLSTRVQDLMRKVDRVTVKGSNQPIDLWTYDVPDWGTLSVNDLAILKSDPMQQIETDSDRFWERFKPTLGDKFLTTFHVRLFFWERAIYNGMHGTTVWRCPAANWWRPITFAEAQ